MVLHKYLLTSQVIGPNYFFIFYFYKHISFYNRNKYKNVIHVCSGHMATNDQWCLCRGDRYEGS